MTMITDIKDATNAGYTPVADDDNAKFLRVTASYTDAEGSGKTAVGTANKLGWNGPGRREGPEPGAGV